MKHLNEFIIEKLKITKDNINFDKFDDLETVVIYIAENVINDYTNIDKSDIDKMIEYLSTNHGTIEDIISSDDMTNKEKTEN